MLADDLASGLLLRMTGSNISSNSCLAIYIPSQTGAFRFPV
jgi:hypothetical protein